MQVESPYQPPHRPILLGRPAAPGLDPQQDGIAVMLPVAHLDRFQGRDGGRQHRRMFCPPIASSFFPGKFRRRRRRRRIWLHPPPGLFPPPGPGTHPFVINSATQSSVRTSKGLPSAPRLMKATLLASIVAVSLAAQSSAWVLPCIGAGLLHRGSDLAARTASSFLAFPRSSSPARFGRAVAPVRFLFQMNKALARPGQGGGSGGPRVAVIGGGVSGLVRALPPLCSTNSCLWSLAFIEDKCQDQVCAKATSRLIP